MIKIDLEKIKFEINNLKYKLSIDFDDVIAERIKDLEAMQQEFIVPDNKNWKAGY